VACTLRSRRKATLRLLTSLVVALTLTAETFPLLTIKASAANPTKTAAAAAEAAGEPHNAANIPWSDILEVIDADYAEERLAKTIARYVSLGYTEQELITALVNEHGELLKQGSLGDHFYEYKTLCNYKDLVTAERVYQACITQLKIERDTAGGIAVKIPIVNWTANPLDTYGVTFRTNRPGHLTLKRTTDDMTMQLFIGLEGCIALIPPGTYTPSFTPLNGTAQTTTYTTSGDISLINGCLVVNGKGQVEIKCETIEVAIYILNETALIDVTDLGEEHSEAFNIVYGKGQLVRINGRIYLRVQLADDPNSQASDKQAAIAEIVEALELKQGIEITVKIHEDIYAFEEAANATNAILKTLRTTTRKIRIAIAELGSPEQARNTEAELEKIYNTLNNQDGNTELQTLNQIAEQAEEQLRQIIHRIERDSQTQLPDDAKKEFYHGCLATLDETRKQIENTEAEIQMLLARDTLNIKVTGPGTTEPRPGRHRYIHGETIDILALPKSTSTLKGFKLDGKEAKARIIDRDGQVAQILSVNMDRDHVVEVEFQNPDDTMAEAIRRATIDRYTIRLREIEEQSQPTPAPSCPAPPKPVGEGPIHDPEPIKTFYLVIWCRPLTTRRTDIYLQPGTPPTVASYYITANIKNYDATSREYRLSPWIDHGNQYRYAVFNTGQKLGDGFLLTETIYQFYSKAISLAVQKEYEAPHDTRIELQENVLIHGLINPGDTLSAAAAKIFGQEAGAPVTGIILYAYSEGEWRIIDNEYYGYLTPKLHPTVTEVYTQFLNVGWWGIALNEAGQTIANIPQNLLQGVQDETNKWKGKINDLYHNTLSRSNGFHAADFLVGELTATWAGFNIAAADIFTFGAITAIERYTETGSTRQASKATTPGQLTTLIELTLDPNIPKEERAKFFGKILGYAAVIAAAAAIGAAFAKIAPKFYAWVLENPGRALLVQKVKTVLGKVAKYGKIANPGLYTAELMEKLFSKLAAAKPKADDSAIGQALDEFAALYETYLNVYGPEYANVKAGELLSYIDDQLRLRKALVDSIYDRVKERFGDDVANTLKKLAEPYGQTSLLELGNLFKTLNALENADLKLREIKILSESTLIGDFMGSVQTALVDVPDQTALTIVAQVRDVVHSLADNGVSLTEIREILASIWTQIGTQQVKADLILDALEAVHRERVEDLYATNGGSRIYTVDGSGDIKIGKEVLKNAWNINIEEKQVLQLRLRRGDVKRIIYAGYDGTLSLCTKVTGVLGNPGEKVEVLEVRRLTIEEFIDKVQFTMQRPEGDLRLRYDSSTVEKITVQGDEAHVVLRERIGAKEETHMVRGQILDYFAWGGEAYVEIQIGEIPQNAKIIRIYQDQEGKSRLVLEVKAGPLRDDWPSTPIRYLEADDVFVRVAYDWGGGILVTGTCISDDAAGLDDLHKISKGVFIHTINNLGEIVVREDVLRKVWNINTEEKQVLKVMVGSIDHSIQETVYAGCDGGTKEYRCIMVVGQLGKPGEKIELLDVQPLPIKEFVDQIYFTVQRPEGDIPLRYELSTLEKITVKGDKAELTFKETFRGKRETHRVEAQLMDYFARQGEAYIDLKIGNMPQNVDLLRIYQNERGECRLVLKTLAGTSTWKVTYLEADDLFLRIAYQYGGRISISETYISETARNLDKMTGCYRLSAIQEDITAGPYKGRRTYGQILSNEELEIIRKQDRDMSYEKGVIGRNVAIKILMETMGFSREKIILKSVHEIGVDIPATDREGNEVAVEVKLTTYRNRLTKTLGEAIQHVERYLRTGRYDYAYAFAVFADRRTGALIIQWVKIRSIEAQGC